MWEYVGGDEMLRLKVGKKWMLKVSEKVSPSSQLCFHSLFFPSIHGCLHPPIIHTNTASTGGAATTIQKDVCHQISSTSCKDVQGCKTTTDMCQHYGAFACSGTKPGKPGQTGSEGSAFSKRVDIHSGEKCLNRFCKLSKPLYRSDYRCSYYSRHGCLAM